MSRKNSQYIQGSGSGIHRDIETYLPLLWENTVPRMWTILIWDNHILITGVWINIDNEPYLLILL